MRRSDIIICPHFQIQSWPLNDKSKFAHDCYCKLDQMIFISEITEKEEPNEEELKRFKQLMTETCSTDCPKIWSDLDNKLNKVDVSPFDEEFRDTYNIFDYDVFEGFYNKPPF